MPTSGFAAEMTALRTSCANLVARVVQIKAEVQVADQLDGQNKPEILANLTLGLRHLEDAAMRFGKAIQASDGGVSPLGGPLTPGK